MKVNIHWLKNITQEFILQIFLSQSDKEEAKTKHKRNGELIQLHILCRILESLLAYIFY